MPALVLEMECSIRVSVLPVVQKHSQMELYMHFFSQGIIITLLCSAIINRRRGDGGDGGSDGRSGHIAKAFGATIQYDIRNKE